MAITRLISEQELLNKLRFMCDSTGQKPIANLLKITPQYLCDVLMKRRKISTQLAKKFGYERIISFKKINP